MADEINFEEYGYSIDPDIVRLADECARLRAALAEAERERDEALLNLSKQTEYAEILAEKAHNMEVQRDEARADADAWKKRYFDAGRSEDAFAADMARLMVDVFKKDEELLKERDAAKDLSERSRRTIRALVVVTRAMWWALDRIASATQVVHLVNLVRTAIRLEAERGQAGNVFNG